MGRIKFGQGTSSTNKLITGVPFVMTYAVLEKAVAAYCLLYPLES